MPTRSFDWSKSFGVAIRRLALLATVCLATGLSEGCSPNNPHNRQAISGRVQWKEQPLDHGTISFEPLAPGGVSSGALVSNGEFSIPPEKGLGPGKYLVRIYSPSTSESAPAGSGADQMRGIPRAAKERVAEKFNTKSQLTIEVTANGRHVFDFETY